MIKENKKKLIITSIIILVPIIIGLVLWNKLPDKLPTHWNSAKEKLTGGVVRHSQYLGFRDSYLQCIGYACWHQVQTRKSKILKEKY